MKKTVYYNTSIGTIGIVEKNQAITEVFFSKDYSPDENLEEETELLKRAGGQIKDYLEGKLKNFDLPLMLEGTEFQKKVWTNFGFYERIWRKQKH